MVSQGLKSIARAVRQVTKQYRDIFPLAKLILDWTTIAGTHVAQTVAPEKISTYKGEKTLVLMVDNAAAKIVVQHQLPIIQERINQLFGPDFIKKITLRQGMPTKMRAPLKILDHQEGSSLECALKRLEKALDT